MKREQMAKMSSYSLHYPSRPVLAGSATFSRPQIARTSCIDAARFMIPLHESAIPTQCLAPPISIVMQADLVLGTCIDYTPTSSDESLQCYPGGKLSRSPALAFR